MQAKIPEHLLRCRRRAAAASHGPKPLAHYLIPTPLQICRSV
jgi:hypothetical protein